MSLNITTQTNTNLQPVENLPKVDLHCHSVYSDGSSSPAELVTLALQAGLQGLALTDHDTIDGLNDLVSAAKYAAAITNATTITNAAATKNAVLATNANTPEHGANTASHPKQYQLNLYAGIEISTEWITPKGKKLSIHVVGLGLQRFDVLQQQLDAQQQARADRAQQMAQKLAKLLNKDPWPEVLASAQNEPKRVTRGHFASWLVQNQFVNRFQQAFDRYLAQGKPAYVAIETLTLKQTIDLIKQCSGIAVLAHPTRYKLSATQTRHLIAEFKHMGGEAIELALPNEPANTQSMIERLAEQHGLMVSYASDFHGLTKPWVRLGKTAAPKEWHNSIVPHLKPMLY